MGNIWIHDDNPWEWGIPLFSEPSDSRMALRWPFRGMHHFQTHPGNCWPLQPLQPWRPQFQLDPLYVLPIDCSGSSTHQIFMDLRDDLTQHTWNYLDIEWYRHGWGTWTSSQRPSLARCKRFWIWRMRRTWRTGPWAVPRRLPLTSLTSQLFMGWNRISKRFNMLYTYNHIYILLICDNNIS